MTFAFVILHYMTFDDTVECIESIIDNIKNKYYHIVLVDNASSNESFDAIKARYHKKTNIHFVNNKTNLGFAKGNNAGFEYAKRKINADFIIMINNDTLIKQEEFLDLINNVYMEQAPYIIGPDIVSTVDYRHQNPQRVKVMTKKEVRKQILKEAIFLILLSTKTEKAIRTLYRFIKQLFRKNRELESKYINMKHHEIMENVELHGSCLIFTPLYIKKYNGIFDDTFMFMEENILYYIAMNEGLKMLYYPSIKIFHKEDISTNALFKKTDEKRKFVYINKIKSARVLLKVMNDREYYIRNITNDYWLGECIWKNQLIY